MQHLAIGDSPQVLWTADVGSGSSSSRILTAPPVVADGKVFAKDAESTVSAFDADTGQRIWSVTLKPEKARDTNEFGGGLAYYGGKLFVTTGFADVFCLDPNDGNGGLELDGERADPRRAAGVRRPRLRHLDRQQAACHGGGRRLGPVELLGPAGGRGLCRRQQPGRLGDVIVAPVQLGRAGRAARSRTAARCGTNRWSARAAKSRAFGNLADIRGRPVIDRGLVLAMGTAGTLAAIDLRSGQRQWERNIGGNQTPWVAGRFVFVVTGAADVAALERDTGKVKWVTPLTQYQDEKRRKPDVCGRAGARVRPAAGRRLDRRDAVAVALYRRDASASSTCGRRCGWRRSWPTARSTS